MNTFLFGVISVLMVSLSIFILLAVGEQFKADSCGHFTNPWCYSDWMCSPEQGGTSMDGTDFPARKLQQVVINCGMTDENGQPDLATCPDQWSNPPLIAPGIGT